MTELPIIGNDVIHDHTCNNSLYGIFGWVVAVVSDITPEGVLPNQTGVISLPTVSPEKLDGTWQLLSKFMVLLFFFIFYYFFYFLFVPLFTIYLLVVVVVPLGA
jgi:hypothetical protein